MFQNASGFIQYLYGMLNVTLPRTAREMAILGESTNLNHLLAGDLVFFGTSSGVTHVAMVYLREGDSPKIIHCSSSTGVVINSFEDDIWKNYWSKRYLFSKRIVGVTHG